MIEHETDSDCRRCYFSQVPAVHDQFFLRAVRPYCWFAAILLFLSYIIGLWFTLRTHAAVIWNAETDEKKPLPAAHAPINGSIHQTNPGPTEAPKKQTSGSGGGTRRPTIHESPIFKNTLRQTLQTTGVAQIPDSRQLSASSNAPFSGTPKTPHLVPPKSGGEDAAAGASSDNQKGLHITGLSEQDNQQLVREVAEVAAISAAYAARDATQGVRKASGAHSAGHHTPKKSAVGAHFETDETDAIAHGGGHDAPNWGRAKSAIILLGATLLYAVIAEILVDTVDVVLQSVEVDEKFLGITLFALVPNTTEFLVGLSR